MSDTNLTPECPHKVALSAECQLCAGSPCCDEFGTGGCRCWEYDVMHGSKYELWETKILPLLEQVLGLQARLRAEREESKGAEDAFDAAALKLIVAQEECDTALRELEQARRELKEETSLHVDANRLWTEAEDQLERIRALSAEVARQDTSDGLLASPAAASAAWGRLRGILAQSKQPLPAPPKES